MEECKAESGNWVGTAALIEGKFIDAPDINLDGVKVQEWLLGSAQPNEDGQYHLTINSRFDDVVLSESVTTSMTKTFMEFEYKGERKRMWYFKEQVEMFKKMYEKFKNKK